VNRPGRLLGLVTYLGGRRARSIDEIASRFDVSPRTAYRDLAELQGQHLVPLVRDEAGYRLMEGATLRPLNLSAEEHALLKVALANPSLRRHPDLRRTLDALEAKLDTATRHVEESPRALQLAGLDRSGPKAAAAITSLRRAIERRRAVAVRYASLSGGTTKRRGIDPWRVFERGEAWYLVGRCHVHDEARIFRLDRMEDVEQTKETSRVPSSFDLERFLEDSWRVFVGREEHEVVLRFDPRLAPLIDNARHHPGERVERLADGTLEYRVTLSSLEEVARWVLGFGGGVTVECPTALRERVRQLARQCLEGLGEGAGSKAWRRRGGPRRSK
jgi:predicted DNA-binding transcriptional regulator YafY